MTTTTRRLGAVLGGLFACVALAACGDDGRGASGFSGGYGSASDSDSDTVTGGEGSTSADSGTSTSAGSDSGDAATTTTTTTAGGSTTGALTSTTGSTTNSSTTGPECVDLEACGVQCVDLSSDPSNCGDCGVSCVIPHASATCQDSACGLGDCEPGFGDCDGEIVNGCETPLEGGQECGAICNPNKDEVCNAFDDNCNDVCDEGAGCRVGVHRSHSASLGHVYTTDLGEASAGDLKLEKQDYYFVYSAQHEGLVPFHRCTKGNGKPFYTKSANCEGNAQLVGVMGYVANGPLCGATELYRLYNSNNGAHFYTTSAGERDNAVAMYGFKYESVAAFVFTGP
ncbi:MAG: hypothetical protein KC486_19595 [Myxococcales bacterium]|nr:hypothetical protein [Myxococcales bacterium]